MRTFGLLLLAAALAVGLGAPPRGAPQSVYFDVDLPAAFLEQAPSVIAPGMTLQMFSDSGSGRIVFLAGYDGLSRLRRLTFRHGLGISRTTPHTYQRVALASLPVESGLAASATSAFRVTDPDGHSAGTVVRGCEGTWCYQFTTQGPVSESTMPHAAWLDGVRVRG